MSVDFGLLAPRIVAATIGMATLLSGVWIACGRRDGAADVERAASRYLDRVYPGRHGDPVCTHIQFEGSYATCEVRVGEEVRRLFCESSFAGEIACRLDP